jgi:hypothetical protein
LLVRVVDSTCPSASAASSASAPPPPVDPERPVRAPRSPGVGRARSRRALVAVDRRASGGLRVAPRPLQCGRRSARDRVARFDELTRAWVGRRGSSR